MTGEEITAWFGNNMGFIILFSSVILVIILLNFIAKRLVKVEPGKALIKISPLYKDGPKVTFTGGFVFPIIHKIEIMDISTKVMPVTRKGTDGLICKDNIRADITVHFYIRVNKNEDDVRQVATSIGCQRASAPDTLNELFQAKFSEALKTVGKQMEYAELFKERTVFKEEIIKTIGRDLNGYKLEDTAIDYLAQTPMNQMDPNDIMDAEGIKKITELTAIQAIKTNEINQEKAETITKRNVEAKERILELEKQQAEAEAKQQAEIDIVRARENAEKEKVIQEERLKAESARIKTEELLSISEANKDREAEIALKNKDRAIIVETERIEKERQLEVTERDKVVAIATIEKEKVVEKEKRDIQEIIKERVAVQRLVAEEEERTKDTHADAEAERNKRVGVKEAEQIAEANLIKGIKAAEAQEKAAFHKAKEKEILAEAEKITSVKLAEAKEILAKGIIAEESARGLADINVREAEAEAIRKKGEAEAEATEMMGSAEAAALKAKMDAEASGLRAKMDAEAAGRKAQYTAEADGLKEKAESMKALDAVGREFEEFKLQLNYKEKLAMENIRVKKDIAMSQAQVIAAALKSAKIDLVGGETEFFRNITNAIIEGKSKSALIENNKVISEFKDALLKPGDENLVKKITRILGELKISSESVKNLSISALIARLLGETEDRKILGQIDQIKSMVEKLGIGDLVIDLKKKAK